MADSLSSLAGWPYDIDGASGPGYPDVLGLDQQWPVYGRVAEIVYPVLGMPSMVEPGGELLVLMAGDPSEDLLDPSQWRGSLTTRARDKFNETEWVGDPLAQTYPLQIDQIDYLDDLGVYELHCTVSPGAPADSYHLVLSNVFFGDSSIGAVFVLNEINADFTFAHISDTHMGDPRGVMSGRWINSADFPGYTDNPKRLVQAILAQQVQELNLLRPDFVLLSGDLVYGLDYVQEYADAYNLLKNSQVPIFMVPGNHDGMTSTINTDEWQFDGLNYFRNIFGPPFYSFDHGPLHFVALNTYDGSRWRRESYPLDPIASPVDNYGGTLAETQLKWLAADMQANKAEGTQLLAFGHHDPRGPYSPNTPFPSHPLGLAGDEWNFDGADWDSDPDDATRDETAAINNGLATLKLLVDQGVSHVFLGHVHSDWVDVFEPGQAIEDYEGNSTGLLAKRAMRWVHTTTACSSVDTKLDYWGYRLIQVSDGILRDVDFSLDPLLGSVPAGNVWTLDLTLNDGTTSMAQKLVNNSLFEPMTVNLEFFLLGEGTGYRVYDWESGEELPIRDVGLTDDGQVALYVRAVIPAACSAAEFPPGPWQGQLRTIVAAPDEENRNPEAQIEIERVDDEDGVFVLSAEGSSDPDDGDSIVRYDWFISAERFDGDRLTYHAPSQGTYAVDLVVSDAHGALGRQRVTVRIKSDDDEDDEEGCGCNASGSAPGASLLTLIFGLAWMLILRRRA